MTNTVIYVRSIFLYFEAILLRKMNRWQKQPGAVSRLLLINIWVQNKH